MYTNMQDQFMEIIDTDQVEDAIDLNEKFLSMALGVDQDELATLPKIELRVDTESHSLQVTGEILSSLQDLKLNDSIIRSFRDLGTSFKNLQVLHIARCELKEVQGILAFEQLEELYISFNQIDDLFDIGKLEHLQILDFEGNNVKQIDQLYYLKRLQRLTDVNFKHNPVQKETAYYSKIKENVPNLQILDDEAVGEDVASFFDQKQKEQRKLNIAQAQEDEEQAQRFNLKNDSIFNRFVQLGLDADKLHKLCEDGLAQLKKEPTEEVLLINTVKNQNKEQKSKQSFEQNLHNFEQFNQTGQTFMTTSDPQRDIRGENLDVEFKTKIRMTSNSFFKTEKSTVMSSTEMPAASHMATANNFFRKSRQEKEISEGSTPGSASDLISNADQVIAGSTMSILRRRGSRRQVSNKFTPGAAAGPIIGKELKGDIQSLINEFHQDASSFKQVSQSQSVINCFLSRKFKARLSKEEEVLRSLTATLGKLLI